MKQILLAFDGGGLCNRLFPFANAVAAGWEHGFQVINPSFHKYAWAFRGLDETSQSVEQMALPGPLPCCRTSAFRARYRLTKLLFPSSVVIGNPSSWIDIEELLKQKSDLTKVWIDSLYVLSRKAFALHADQLRAIFRPLPSLEERVTAYVNQLKTGTDLLIGTHIRQGDYAQHDRGMLYYDSSEYAGLMHKVKQLLAPRNVRFLVCSNVPQAPECFRGLDYYEAFNDELLDLYALASTDLIIGAPSSYTQWASFYGKVPRYVYNRKYEEAAGMQLRPPTFDHFSIHTSGFGRYDSI